MHAPNTSTSQRNVLLLFGAPLLAIALTVSVVVLVDYFRAPPDFAIVVIAVANMNGVLAFAGSAIGALWLCAQSRWRIPIALLAGSLSLAAYIFFSVVISYLIVVSIANVQTGRFVG